MPLVAGTRYNYEGEDEDGTLIRVEVFVTHETRLVMGVTCIVVEDIAFENGEFISTHGSWEAGVDGALPGLEMLLPGL